jgi:phytol kinase
VIPLFPSLPPPATLAGESARGAIVGGAFLAIFAIAETWRRRFAPPVEWTRKFVHFAGGVVAASFPWMFGTHWTVLALGGAFAGIIALGRATGRLGSVTEVERRSQGELYYPVGVYLLFVIARHQPVYYLIALSALVLSDTAAALLGRSYGRHAFPVGGDLKSLEGSAVFFLATFLGVHVPLLLGTPVDRAASLLIAFQIALLVTSFEAISMRGNDNLIVPLATYYLLLKLGGAGAEHVAIQLVAQLGFLAVTLLIASRTRFLTFAGALAAHLMLYAAFSLGGPAWSLAPALALAALLVIDEFFSRDSGRPGGGHQVQAVFWVSIVAVALIFADNTLATLVPHPSLGSGHPFYAPFVGALAAQVAILAWQLLRWHRFERRLSNPTRALAAATLGFALIAPASLALAPGGPNAEAFAVPAAMCALALALYLGARRLLPHRADPRRDLRLQTLSVAAATLLVTPMHLLLIGAL